MRNRGNWPIAHVRFKLTQDSDGWPPVGTESLPAEWLGPDLARIQVPPLFVKNLSVGDAIRVTLDEDGYVQGFTHEKLSKRSTIWVLGGKDPERENLITDLKRLGCNVERFREIKLLSIDVPADVAFPDVEAVLVKLEAIDADVAEPSRRHG